MSETVEIDSEEVDKALETLEEAMRAGERSLSHDEVRPSTHMLAKRTRDAYKILVDAHVDYEFVEGGNDE